MQITPKTSVFLAGFCLAARLARAEITLTIPAAASSHGANGTSFHSDLWLVNRSYTRATPVTLTYRCFAGQSCGKGTVALSLSPRESRLLADVVAITFASPETAGAIEVSYDGGP